MNKVKTIFVVEDSKIISEIIALKLKNRFNCIVKVFQNGDDIINQIKKHSPDLVVLDYNFNEAELTYNSGLEVLVELRQRFKIPVIVFSGQRDKEKAVELIQKGANDYISKDDDDFMDNLLNSIEDAFSF